jgi:hypothetical protein
MLDLGTTGEGDGHASLGPNADAGTQLQYWTGVAWVDYVPGTFVKIPGSDHTAGGQLRVRVAVYQDFIFEDRETLTLIATNTGGSGVSGEGAIRDDGKGLLFGPANTTATPDTLAALGLQVLDDDRVAPPIPVPPAAPPPLPEPPRPPAQPALHVQLAVAESRQPLSSPAVAATAAGVVTRSAGSLAEGINVIRRLDTLYAKFDRITDPNLYVLPEVKVTRGQSYDAQEPAFLLQSGLLTSDLDRLIGSQVPVTLTEAPTLADQTLAAMAAAASEGPAEPERLAEVEAGERLSDLRWRLALMLEAAQAAESQAHEAAGVAADPWHASTGSSAPQLRGQLGFRGQMQSLAAQRPIWQGGEHG